MYALLPTVASVATCHSNSPFLVKDNQYANDKPNTREGGLVLLVEPILSGATVITKLREAGGVLLQHAAFLEAADRALVNFSDGFSTRIGQTRKPFQPHTGQSGCSGGSLSQ